jgi:D-3-phosphoglycerate dehydrogenase
LTAFLPPDYPLAEESGSGDQAKKRQGVQKILLLENINNDAANYLKDAGFEVSSWSTCWTVTADDQSGRPSHESLL